MNSIRCLVNAGQPLERWGWLCSDSLLAVKYTRRTLTLDPLPWWIDDWIHSARSRQSRAFGNVRRNASNIVPTCNASVSIA
jgi:hypothetical protein